MVRDLGNAIAIARQEQHFKFRQNSRLEDLAIGNGVVKNN